MVKNLNETTHYRKQHGIEFGSIAKRPKGQGIRPRQIKSYVALEEFSIDINDKHFLNTKTKKKQLRKWLKENKIETQKYVETTFTKGIFSEKDYLKKFTITGALIVENLDVLGIPCKKFFTSIRGRYFEKSNSDGKIYILRGPRYLVALKPHLSVPLKLKMLYDDIIDGVNALLEINNYDEIKQHYEIYPILDYLKNALVTIYNAYTHQEKFKPLEQLEKEHKNYTKLKGCVFEALEEAVFCCYLSLINEFNADLSDKLTKSINEVFFSQVFDSISDSFKSFIFSSRAIVRPEASHPIVIAAFCHKICSKYSDVDFIFGLPAGGTEIASLIHKYMEHITEKKKELILIPISTHSLKRYNVRKIDKNDILKIFPQSNIINKKAILIDDNSSSGKSIEEASRIIKQVYRNISLKCRVAEVDWIRAELRFKEKNGKKDDKIANHILFQDAIGILPISKSIKPKYDLKELIETNDLLKHYRSFFKNENNLIKEIQLQVITDAIRNKVEDAYEKGEYTSENSIRSFKGTFLSNFHPVAINEDNKIFPSVEHAYCSKKYDMSAFESLTPQQKEELNEVLLEKELETIDDFSSIFESSLPAGVIKKILNVLKSWKFTKKDDNKWDEDRLSIMIGLLIKKFTQYELATKLLQTENKVLIEGNDWNDTFWGVCKTDGVKRGHNFLGRILVVIRNKIKNKEVHVEGYEYDGVLNKLVEVKK
jgi:predicted NAD-dependent protein-ADP-ribosyltransferase YbiA (DUF1768 family)/hypoxanthine phosphoribosyltransferase